MSIKVKELHHFRLWCRKKMESLSLDMIPRKSIEGGKKNEKKLCRIDR